MERSFIMAARKTRRIWKLSSDPSIHIVKLWPTPICHTQRLNIPAPICPIYPKSKYWLYWFNVQHSWLLGNHGRFKNLVPRLPTRTFFYENSQSLSGTLSSLTFQRLKSASASEKQISVQNSWPAPSIYWPRTTTWIIVLSSFCLPLTAHLRSEIPAWSTRSSNRSHRVGFFGGGGDTCCDEGECFDYSQVLWLINLVWFSYYILSVLASCFYLGFIWTYCHSPRSS